MAREFGQLRHDLWLDDDWLDLTAPAQWLYMTLLGDGNLTYAGVTTWHAGKIAARAKEWSAKAVVIAAAELADARFVVIDEDTEEVAIRAYLRKDPLMKNPRLAVSMAKAYQGIASRKIRAVVVWELQRLKREQPDLGAWEKPEVKTILRQNAVNPREVVTDLPVAAGQYIMDTPLGVA